LFRRVNDIFIIDNETFSVNDILSVFPEYIVDSCIHYYDRKKHYKSDGKTQIGLATPYELGDRILQNIVHIRMCKNQREIDERYLEHVRTKRK
jgi:hypothetical protein